MKKKIIYGCEARGDESSPYLIRYSLFECKYFQICLHVFLRSDHQEHHDHPWNFLSIVLWRGYFEETIIWPECKCCGRKMSFTGKAYLCWCVGNDHVILYNQEPRKLKRYWPGMILFRKAAHRHRVVLVNEKKAVTLVIMGKYRKSWGFFTNSGWLEWKKYFVKNKC
jgi:hypothetical protein